MRKFISILLCTVYTFTGIIQVQAEDETAASEQTEETQQTIDSDESEETLSSDSSETVKTEENDAETEEAVIESNEEEEIPEKIDFEIQDIEKTVAPSAETNSKETEDTTENTTDALFTYSVHMQNVGWMSEVNDGEVAGITERSLRMEALKIIPSEEISNKGDIIGQAHVQNHGWMAPVSSNGTIGTNGAGLRIEAIRFWLSGSLADEYDIYYRAHVQNNGWLGWASNGADAGSTGVGLRIEAIQIQLVKKGMLMNAAPASSTITGNGLSYQAHVQNIGWAETTAAPYKAGTTGRSLRMEALIINLPDNMKEYGNLSIEAHVQNRGWLSAVGSGALAGTEGAGLRLEALKIRLTGDLADQYDIWYRTHVAGYGWLGWTANGGIAGSVSLGKAIEAVEIDLVPKGMNSHSYSTAYVTKQAGASRSGIVSTARSWVGVGRYAYGGNDPRTGTDCAGFVQYVFRQHGINLARSSYEMVNNGYQIPASQVKAGDLAIWSGHVAIMSSANTCVQALNPSLGIREMRMGTFTASGYFLGYYRINGVAN